MENLWEFAYDNIPNVKQICQPLERLGIQFAYERIFKDGLFFGMMSSNHQLYKTLRDDQFVSRCLKASQYFISEVFSAQENQLENHLWPIGLHTPHQALFYSHNVRGGISFMRKNVDSSVECWYFTSDKPLEVASAFLLSHSDILKQFIHYFNNNAKELKESYHSNNLILPKLHKALIASNNIPAENEDIIHFLQDIQIKHHNFTISPGRNVNLSKREIECLYHLSVGKITKEIAFAMGLSPRTIEDYIQSIKVKTNLYRRSQLVELFTNNKVPFTNF
jgi:DNA-binding CsgD family transcriptional regulator